MATYIEKNLSSGENVRKQVKAHWTNYIATLFFALLTVSCFTVDVGVGLLVALFTIYMYLRVYLTQYALTNKRIVLRRGVVTLKTDECQLTQIESANIKIGVLDRIFGGGSVVITMTGGKRLTLKNVDSPASLKSEIMDTI
ncbi:PH domain-containing protein [Vibrio cholerae]